MATLILLVLVGIISATFATQNTSLTSINIANYKLTGIPLYLIVLVSVLAGLVLSSIISLVNSIASSLIIHSKDTKIKETNRSINDLTKQIHQLELENTQLKTELDTKTDDKSL